MKLTLASVLGILCLSLLLPGCGSSNHSSTGTTNTNLQFVLPAASPQIDPGQSVNLQVNQSVTWTLQDNTGRTITAGLTNQSATSVTYTAPAGTAGATAFQVSVIATSVADTTQSAAMPVMVNPTLAITGALSSANKSCQYSPITQVGAADGNAGIAFSPNRQNPPTARGGTGPFTWTLTTGTLPAGLSLGSVSQPPSPSTAFLQGTPVTPGCSQVTLTVTDATGTSVTSPTFYVIIAPAPLKTSVPNYTDAYTGTPYPPTTITVSGGQPPYNNWTAAQLPQEMVLTQSPQNSGAAVITGTPNGTPQQSYPAGVTVFDSQTPYPATGSASLNLYQWLALPSNACVPAQNGGTTLTINTANGNLHGSYAFLIRGFDASGPVAMAGSFSADGAGNVTGGTLDVMRTSGSQTAAPISGGSYSVLEQNGIGVSIFEQSGCLALTTAAGTTRFAISMGGCSTTPDPGSGACLADMNNSAGVFTTGRLVEFDDNTGLGTRGSGIVRLQDSSTFAAGLSGQYAFGLRGWDSSSKRYAEAGSFTASSGTLTAVAADINDGGTMQSALTGGTGTVGTVDPATGRATATLSVGSPALSSLAMYVVNSGEAIVVDTGIPGPASPVISGEAIETTGPFNFLSLQNTHMFHTSGLATGGPDPAIGLINFDGLGDFTGTQYENQAATLGTTSISGNYSVDAGSGRVLFYSTGNPPTLGDHPLVGYVLPPSDTLTRQNCVKLSSCVTAFLLSTDSSVQAGELDFQTSINPPPPPFSNLYVTGYYFYGTDEVMDSSTFALSGASAADPTGAKYAGIQSVSFPNSTYCQQPGCTLLIPNETLSVNGTYSVSSNGSGSIGGETVSITNGNLIFYLDESPLNLHPTLTVVEQ